MVKLRAMRLCSVTGETRSEFGTDEVICLEIEYRIVKKVFPFRVGFSLHTIDGIYVFYTSDSDLPTHGDDGISFYDREFREPGHYISRCQIPSNWMNVGSYFLRVDACIFGVRSFFDDAPGLGFTVFSTGGPTSRFNEKRHGVLRPSMSWEIVSE